MHLLPRPLRLLYLCPRVPMHGISAEPLFRTPKPQRHLRLRFLLLLRRHRRLLCREMCKITRNPRLPQHPLVPMLILQDRTFALRIRLRRSPSQQIHIRPPRLNLCTPIS